MINFEKSIINDNDIIILNNNKSKLRLCKYLDNIQWIFTGNNGDNTFVITMDDYEIYETFLNLYSAIENGNLFDEDELKEISDDSLYGISLCDYNTEVKSTDQYKKLFNDGVITFVSDSLFPDEADSVVITKGEDYFMLEFNGVKPSNIRTIKFVNNKLNYFSLNKPIFRHFDEISKIDLSYHQINFYDVLKMKKDA